MQHFESSNSGFKYLPLRKDFIESLFPGTVDPGVVKTVYRVLVVDKSTKSVVRKTARLC